ncbi:hypothetical protein BU26DRAFT_558928 [Trematosphaeria pertusa]|uniref:Uncharacterized protein n=1 Tax=Trematosphaeria pertusa TaxID=390896 RepID=A0A6A6IVW5_9PLEO|nr:uncharacterized protein BU26DRAFT_558928 [Trematosphaeria pertusa]KAF2254217.1 hypothetical protein BU26DRAFT_558928 [Trematosphaeria pertusa]
MLGPCYADTETSRPKKSTKSTESTTRLTLNVDVRPVRTAASPADLVTFYASTEDLYVKEEKPSAAHCGNPTLLTRPAQLHPLRLAAALRKMSRNIGSETGEAHFAPRDWREELEEWYQNCLAILQQQQEEQEEQQQELPQVQEDDDDDGDDDGGFRLPSSPADDGRIRLPSSARLPSSPSAPRPSSPLQRHETRRRAARAPTPPPPPPPPPKKKLNSWQKKKPRPENKRITRAEVRRGEVELKLHEKRRLQIAEARKAAAEKKAAERMRRRR